MAGSSVTQTRSSNSGRVKGPPTQVIVEMACVSDSANGLVPTEPMDGLRDFVLIHILPILSATVPFTSPFEIRIDDSAGNPVYKSGSIAVDRADPVAGTDASGGYARMDAANTFKIVDPSDHASTLSVGNSKASTFRLRFERRW